MPTTLPPPTLPSLPHAVVPLAAPAGAAAWRTEARPHSWHEFAAVLTPHVVRQATFHTRVWARTVDLFVYGGPIALAIGLAVLVVPRDADGLPANTKTAALVIAAPVVVAAIMAFRMLRALALEGSTVGRQARRVVVVRLGSGQPLGYGRAAVRLGTELLLRLTIVVTFVLAFRVDDAPEIALTAFICAVLLNVVDAAWMLWDPHHQTFCDKAAGSMVIED